MIKRLRGCGAGCEYVAITPEGDIYPCHQFVGNEDYKLGSLYDGTFDKELSGRFAGLNIYTRRSAGTAGRGSTARVGAARPTCLSMAT